MSASPDLDPHWSTLPHAEVLAVLPEGTAATVEQMLARLCPAPDPMPAFDSLQGFAYSMGTTSTAGKLNNALREMVHAGTLCQFPPGRDLHAAVFWRAGDLAGQGEAAALEFGRLRVAVDAIAERYRAARALAEPAMTAHSVNLAAAHAMLCQSMEALPVPPLRRPLTPDEARAYYANIERNGYP